MNLKYQQQKGLIYIFLGRREKRKTKIDRWQTTAAVVDTCHRRGCGASNDMTDDHFLLLGGIACTA
jgi:hypothetical protein